MFRKVCHFLHVADCKRLLYLLEERVRKTLILYIKNNIMNSSCVYGVLNLNCYMQRTLDIFSTEFLTFTDRTLCKGVLEKQLPV